MIVKRAHGGFLLSASVFPGPVLSTGTPMHEKGTKGSLGQKGDRKRLG